AGGRPVFRFSAPGRREGAEEGTSDASQEAASTAAGADADSTRSAGSSTTRGVAVAAGSVGATARELEGADFGELPSIQALPATNSAATKAERSQRLGCRSL